MRDGRGVSSPGGSGEGVCVDAAGKIESPLLAVFRVGRAGADSLCAAYAFRQTECVGGVGALTLCGKGYEGDARLAPRASSQALPKESFEEFFLFERGSGLWRRRWWWRRRCMLRGGGACVADVLTEQTGTSSLRRRASSRPGLSCRGQRSTGERKLRAGVELAPKWFAVLIGQAGAGRKGGGGGRM